jgi:hypothetical protein
MTFAPTAIAKAVPKHATLLYEKAVLIIYCEFAVETVYLLIPEPTKYTKSPLPSFARIVLMEELIVVNEDELIK